MYMGWLKLLHSSETIMADDICITSTTNIAIVNFIPTYLTNIMFGSGLYCPTGLLIAVKAKRSVSGPRGVLLEMLLHLKSNTMPLMANESSSVLFFQVWLGGLLVHPSPLSPLHHHPPLCHLPHLIPSSP